MGAGISVADGNLVVLGNTILSDVHDNIVITPAAGDSLISGAFIGVHSDRLGSRRVFPVGKLQYDLNDPSFLFFLLVFAVCVGLFFVILYLVLENVGQKRGKWDFENLDEVEV